MNVIVFCVILFSISCFKSVLTTLSVEIKVRGKVPCPEMDFYSRIKEFKTLSPKDVDNQELIIEKLYKPFIKKTEIMEKELNKEIIGIIEIVEIFGWTKIVQNMALASVLDEKHELTLRKNIIEQDNYLKLKLMASGKTTDVVLKDLKEAAIKWETNSIFKKCLNRNMMSCFGSDSNGKKVIKEIKTWLLAQQMFGEPDMEGNRIPEKFIRPHWELLIKYFNVPAGQFLIATIPKELNFNHLMANSENDISVSIGKMNVGLLRLKYKYSKYKDLNDEMKLRSELLKYVFSNLEPIPLTFEIISRRIKIIERIAQGVIRSVQIFNPINRDGINEMIKIWLIIRQMFKPYGWKMIDGFGNLPMPKSYRNDL